ncbi:MAG: serine hydrolase [Betaproteobacteria bacterium]|nr:serine hydrolase [Betaproteobacteria bacterium]
MTGDGDGTKAATGSLHDRIDTELERACATGRLPGVVAAVTTGRGTVYTASFGRRHVGCAEAMTPDTVCWIASMTKPVTAVAAMQLVERGDVSLDEPIGRVRPELAAIRVLTGWTADGEPVLRDPVRPITLRHLLTHTSGLAHGLWNADLGRYQKLRGLPATISGRLGALDVPLVFDPGERWEYGIGVDWLGRVVEAVTGERLGEYFRTRVFEPLGMGSTGFRITPDMRRRLACVHARGIGDALEPTAFEVEQDPEWDVGGGGLYSTAGDYLRFMRMILNRGELDGVRVLARDTVELMGRNAMGALRVRPLASANPAMTRDVDFHADVQKTWGLSFMINETALPTGRSPGSLTWAGLANTYFWIDPTRDLAGVFLTQILPFADPAALDLFGRFETAVYKSRD